MNSGNKKIVQKPSKRVRKQRNRRAKKAAESNMVRSQFRVNGVDLRKHRVNGAVPKVVTYNPLEANQKSNLLVATPIVESSFNLPFVTLVSFMSTKGVFGSPDIDPQVLYNGIIYLKTAIGIIIGGGTAALTVLPYCFLELISALRGKSVTFLTYGDITYSWSNVGGIPPAITPVNVSAGVWSPVICDSDNNTYNSQASVYNGTGDVESYAVLIKTLEGMTPSPALRIVEFTKDSVLSKDVSAFARSYTYNGLKPTPTSGYYKDIENEVTITSPIMSAFCQYTVPDTRVPMKLTPFSGDACLSVGWPLHVSFNSYFNKKAPVFKQIDFEWIYYTYATFLSAALSKITTHGGSPAGIGDNFSFPCTTQDFRIILRQALLNVFDTQYMTQFTGALEWSDDSNVFVPFMVGASTYGATSFSDLLMPMLLVENFSALRCRSIDYRSGKKPSKLNRTTIFPVLGRHVLDVPATFVWINSIGESIPLFNDSIVQTPINLVDGTTSAGNYVNLNSVYYQTVKSDINLVIQELSEVTTEVGSIVGDQGPQGLGLLYYTSVVEKVAQQEPATEFSARRMAMYTNIISNRKAVDPPPLTRKNSKEQVKQVKIVEPATFVSLGVVSSTQNCRLPAEMSKMLQTLITPEIRLDPAGTTDPLTQVMYQTEVREPLSIQILQRASDTGSGLSSRLGKLGRLCVPGLAKNNDGDEYTRALAFLRDHNKAGMLGKLLGGVAKSFLPGELHDVVDAVGDIIPF